MGIDWSRTVVRRWPMIARVFSGLFIRLILTHKVNPKYQSLFSMRIFDKNTMAATVHSNSSHTKKNEVFAIIAVAPWPGSGGRTVAPPKLALCRGVGPVLLTPSPPLCSRVPFILPQPPTLRDSQPKSGPSTWSLQALHSQPPAQRGASMVLWRPGIVCPQSVCAHSCWHVQAYPTF